MFNLPNLRSDTRFLVFGDSTNTEYDDTDLDRNINRWYETVISWILSANGDWQVNGEISITNLKVGQREYIVPTDILKLNKLYIKSTSSGEYIEAKQRDISSIHVDNEKYHPATPEFDLFDNSIFIYIPEDTITDVTGGLKFIYQTDITELTGTNSPNIAEPFKRLLSFGPALDYCEANELWGKAKKFSNRIYGDPTVKKDEGLKGDLLKYYSNRSTAKKIKLAPKRKNFV